MSAVKGSIWNMHVRECYTYRQAIDTWRRQWTDESAPVRKEEIHGLMSVEVTSGTMIKGSWIVRSFFRDTTSVRGQWIGSAHRLLLMLELTAPKGMCAVEFAKKILQGERPKWSELPASMVDTLRCVVWRQHVSTLWHEEGCRVLMTCDVPLAFFQCELSTVSFGEYLK